MNRQQWLARVASHAAAELGASNPEEVVYDYDQLTPAEQDRIDWAIEEVQIRLYRMGAKDTY